MVKLYLCLISLFCFSCGSSNVFFEGDFLDIYKKAQFENKKLWVIFGGGNSCVSCNNLLKDMRNEKIFSKYKDEYFFYKCNISEPNNKFMLDILLLEQIPNSCIFDEKGKLIYVSANNENARTVKRAIKDVANGVRYHYRQNQFQTKGSKQLLVMHNNTIEANIDYLVGKNNLTSINKSIAIEPYFYNLYLKYKILVKQGDQNIADSTCRLALEYAKVGWQAIIYEKLYKELSPNVMIDSINVAKLKLRTNQINSCKFSYGSYNKLTIEVINLGTKPLVMYHVSTDCSCAKVEYSTKPIMPNEKTEIKLTYDAASKGVFSKNVTIQSNAVNHIERVKISGVVE